MRLWWHHLLNLPLMSCDRRKRGKLPETLPSVLSSSLTLLVRNTDDKGNDVFSYLHLKEAKTVTPIKPKLKKEATKTSLRKGGLFWNYMSRPEWVSYSWFFLCLQMDQVEPLVHRLEIISSLQLEVRTAKLSPGFKRSFRAVNWVKRHGTSDTLVLGESWLACWG